MSRGTLLGSSSHLHAYAENGEVVEWGSADPNVKNRTWFLSGESSPRGRLYSRVSLSSTRDRTLSVRSACPGSNAVLGCAGALLTSLGLQHPTLGCHSHHSLRSQCRNLSHPWRTLVPCTEHLPTLPQVEALAPLGASALQVASALPRHAETPLSL